MAPLTLFVLLFAFSASLALGFTLHVRAVPLTLRLRAALWVAMLSQLPIAAVALTMRLHDTEPPGCLVAVSLYMIGFLGAGRPLIDPTWRGHLGPMREPDASLCATVEEVSAALRPNAPPPRLKVRPTGEGFFTGVTGCVESPVVLLDADLVEHLEPEQLRALIAHELAHHSTGTLWWTSFPAPVAVAVAILVGPWISPFAQLGLAAVLYLLLKLWLSRRTELLCDNRAAETTSPAATHSMLTTVHARHPIPETTKLGRLAHALATHPPLSIRLAALDGTATAASRARHRESFWAQVGLVMASVTALAVAIWAHDPEAPSTTMGSTLETLAGFGLLGLYHLPSLTSLSAARGKPNATRE